MWTFGKWSFVKSSSVFSGFAGRLNLKMKKTEFCGFSMPFEMAEQVYTVIPKM